MMRTTLQWTIMIATMVGCMLGIGANNADAYRIDFKLKQTERRYDLDFPAGWEVRGSKWGVPSTKFYVSKRGEEDFLVVDADHATGAIMFDVHRFVDLRKTPIMRWRWRAKRLPPGGDGRNPNKDDQVLSIYVGFGSVIRKTVAYRWETDTPRGSSGKTSYGSGLVRVTWFCLNNKTSPLDQWVITERNIAEDMKTIYGEVPKEFAVSICGNSQYTDSHSVGEIDYIEFVSPNR